MNDLFVRPPTLGEMPRVMPFFSNDPIRPQAQILVAVKSKPVERFVGALAGWLDGEYGKFLVACLPGTARREAAQALIEQAAARARTSGLRHLMYGKRLPDHDETFALLREHGLFVMRTERFFELGLEAGIARVTQLLDRHRASIPTDWHAESIRHHPPETVLNLIAEYRLMPPDEIRAGWQWGEPDAFHPDFSVILFQKQEAFATLLVRIKGDVAWFDVRVVRHPDPRLAGLANLHLFYHCLKTRDPSNPVRRLQFRSGETEHLETANMARRMGAKEIPPRHVLVLAL